MDKAFEILVQQHRPMLLCYARSLLYGDADSAEDVVQESFLAAHQNFGRFQGENFACWLRGIARNKALESRRAARRRRTVVDSRIIEGIDEVYAVFDAPLAGEEQWPERARRWVLHCVDQLGQRLKNAVVRVYRDGIRPDAAAAEENVSYEAFAQRLSRARGLIRKCVRAQSENES